MVKNGSIVKKTECLPCSIPTAKTKKNVRVLGVITRPKADF